MKTDRKSKFIFAAVAVVCGLAGLFFLNRPGERFSQTRTFPMMGTVGRITVFSDRESLPEKVLDQIQQSIGSIEKTCNVFDPGSELSRLNGSAHKQEFVCSPLLWEMIGAADRYCRLTGGAYDPSVRPLMKLWGFHRKRKALPTAAEIREVMKKVGWSKVKLDPEKRSVRFTAEGLELDFGGLAKGFALEKAMEIAREAGVGRAIFDLGGNIGCLAPEKRGAFRIGIRDPESPSEILGTVEMRDSCVATSGNYERYVIIEGKTYAHIMDPLTGMPVSGMLSATVVTPRGTDSDALSTAVFVRGESFAEEICRKIPGTGVLIVRRAEKEPGGRKILRFGSLVR